MEFHSSRKQSLESGSRRIQRLRAVVQPTCSICRSVASRKQAPLCLLLPRLRDVGSKDIFSYKRTPNSITVILSDIIQFISLGTDCLLWTLRHPDRFILCSKLTY